MELSISSLRADSLTEDLAASLARGGHRTLTIAPEAGHRAAAPGDPQGDHRRADPRRLRPGPGAGHPESQDVLHDRPADRDRRGRGGDRRSRPAHARAPARARRQGPSVRAAHAVDLVVRAQAVDAVPVGAVRRRRRAEPQARDDQAAGCARSPTCACCTRTRARRRCRRCWPAATGAWPTSWSGRRASTATGAGRCASGTATPSSTRRGRGHVDERMPWDHFEVGVKKIGPGPRVGAGRGRRAGPVAVRLMAPVTDVFGRALRNLRISVTDRCNLRCALLHAGGGLRLAAARGDPALRGDQPRWPTSSWTSASTRCGSPAASRCCGATCRGWSGCWPPSRGSATWR